MNWVLGVCESSLLYRCDCVCVKLCNPLGILSAYLAISELCF